MYKLTISILLVTIVAAINCNTLADAPKAETNSFDSLIASQCKSKCLSMYPWWPTSTMKRSIANKRYSINQQQLHHHADNHIKWHKVMELCANNQICLQCSLPCDIPKNLLPNCKFLCQNRHSSCIDSCELVQRLNDQKYGTCPSPPPSNTTQTQPQCIKDSDCEDTQKCCDGGRCERAIITQSPELPSVPFNLTIVERKKGKTAILSWNCDYQASKPTLFVVEGRWALNSDPTDDLNASMTKWGYLAQTVNNNWLILRSIHRGRWYRFRVAAVSPTGTLGYSASTDLFMLSSAPKAASQPQNLSFSLSESLFKNESHLAVDLAWLPPKRSDLPLDNYVVSVFEFKNESVSLDGDYSELDFDDDDDDEAGPGGRLGDFQYGDHDAKYFLYAQNLVKASRSRLTRVVLRRDRSYLVKVVAVSRYRVAELRSSASTLVIRRDETVPKVEFDNALLVNSLRLSAKPYFQNGLVKAKIGWVLNTNLVRTASEFKVTWFASKCAEAASLPLPISAKTSNGFYEVYELRFGCDYVVNVQLVDASGHFALLKNIKSYSAMQLKVPACDSIEVVGALKPLCETRPPQSKAFLGAETTTSTSVASTTRSSTTTSSEAPYVPLDNLPLIINITHKAIKVSEELFNAEFRWKLQPNPKAVAKDALGLISGFQINIVPKTSAAKFRNDVQSIAAIVDKKQAFFVATRLVYHVSYTFHIKLMFSDEFNEAIDSYSDESDRFVMSKLSTYTVNFKVTPPKTRSKTRPNAQLHNDSMNYFYYLRNQNQNKGLSNVNPLNGSSPKSASYRLMSLLIVFVSFFCLF